MGLELSVIILFGMLLVAFYLVLGIAAAIELIEPSTKPATLRRRLLKAATVFLWPVVILVAVLIGAYRTITD